MVAERTATKSPIHVHVAKDTPVHVHVRRPKKKLGISHGIPSAVEQRLSERQSVLPKKIAGKGGKGSKKKAMKISHGSVAVSSIPPRSRAGAAKDSFAWEGKNHRLEINKPRETSLKRSLRISDLSTSEDEGEQDGNIYKEQISELLDEVGTLRNEVELQKSSRVSRKKDEQIDASRVVIEEQENELEGYKSELGVTMKENEKLRHSVDKLKDEMEMSRSEAEHLGNEKMALLRKLVETEQDSKAAAVEISKLRNNVHSLKEDKKLTTKDLKRLERHRGDLLQRLQDFEETNRNLRKLLRAAHRREEEEEKIADQRNVLVEKLTETEKKLRESEFGKEERDRQIETLISQVEADKEQARAFDELQKTMEATRAHLQGQLRIKEQENSRLSVRNKTVEEDLKKHNLELEHLQGLLAATRDKSSKDKEALKKATRLQRERANKNEGALETLNQQLLEKEAEVSEMQRALETLKEKYNKVYREKTGLDTELSLYRSQMQELKATLSTGDKGKGVSIENVVTKVNDSIQEMKLVRVENERLRNDLRSTEDKLRATEKSAAAKATHAQNERNTLQSAVEQYQGLVTEYKAQVEQYKRENDELSSKLLTKERELTRELSESSREMDKVRSNLQSRLSELEPYPELLKVSEARLQEAHGRVTTYEERSTEQTRLIADLTQKVEAQSDHIDRLREKYRDKQDEVKTLVTKLDNLERKLTDVDGQNRELMSVVSKREESMRMMQDRLEDQRHENNRLIQQLEVALADAKRQVEQQKEKAITKERTAQARILDLEAQLSRSSATAQQLKKAKEETERKFNSRLQDMRDRLEQANSTTRSMQNYVNFLKSTYSSVFSDAAEDMGGLPF